jgi:polar amino acid transport system substrate-binding protein
MPHVTRRRALMLAAALPATPALAGGPPVEIMTSAFPPMTMDDAARPGLVNHVLRDMLRMVGREGRFVHTAWADAQRRAREEPGRLITPLARTAAREAHFNWMVKVLDIESMFATLGPRLDLAAARGVARVGVMRGALHQAHLQQNGFTNLVEFATLPEMVNAMLQRQVDAVFSNVMDIRVFAIQQGRGNDVAVGPAVLTLPVFIASGRNTADLPVADLEAAFAALEQDGTVARLYAEYTGGVRRG